VILTDSGLFDLAWYELEAGREFANLRAAVRHYRRTGWRMGLSPHPLFNPRDARSRTQELTPFSAYLFTKDLWAVTPHLSWNLGEYLRRHPDAVEHPYGPLGHLNEHFDADTVLDLRTLDGTEKVRWGDVSGEWAELARAWTSQRRTLLPDYRNRLPDNHQLPESAPVAESSETLVSVIMPTRNRAPTLRRAIASVQAQSWRHWELIVVDDRSDDDTPRIVEAFSARDPRVRLVSRTQAGGASAARNSGLEHARGGLVAFLNDNGLWEREFLESMVRATQAGGLVASYATVVENTDEGPRYRARQVSHSSLLVGDHVNVQVLMLQANFVRRLGGFDERLLHGEGYDLVLRAAKEAELVHVPVIGMVLDAAGHESRPDSRPWRERVQLEQRIDWRREQRVERDAELVSVVVPALKDYSSVVAQLGAIRDAFHDRPWEAVVVDCTPQRHAVSSLAGALARCEGAHYERLPVRVSFAYAANVGFVRSRGSTVFFVGEGVVPTQDGLRRLLAVAGAEQGPFIAQPIAVDQHEVVLSAGAVFSRSHTIPAPLLAGHLSADAAELGPGALELQALYGESFVTRAADFAHIEGLDPLMAGGLELTDYGLRLKAAVAQSRQLVVGDAFVRGGEHAASPDASRVARDVFIARHAANLEPTPDDFWRAWGLEVAGWQRIDGVFHRIRPLLYRSSVAHRSVQRRWVLLTGAERRPPWLLMWARALADALERRGDRVVVQRGTRADHQASYLDDIVVSLDPSAQLPDDRERLLVAWPQDAPWRLTDANIAGAHLALCPGPDGSSMIVGANGRPLSLEGGWSCSTLGVQDIPERSASLVHGDVLVVGDASYGPLMKQALESLDIAVRGVGPEWIEHLGDGAWIPWPDTARQWAGLLSAANRVVVLRDRGSEVEQWVPPLLLDVLLVRGEVVTNGSVPGEPWSQGIAAFSTPDELGSQLRNEPRALGVDELAFIRRTRTPEAVAAVLLDRLTAVAGADIGGRAAR
jgi:hypothetical protein